MLLTMFDARAKEHRPSCADADLVEQCSSSRETPMMCEGAETACCTPMAGATESGRVQMGVKRGCC